MYPNVVYKAFKAPNLTRAYLPTCSAQIIDEIPLATFENNFSVTLFNNIPGLTWSAEYEQNAESKLREAMTEKFNFFVIKKLPLQYRQSEYNFSDKQVNTQSEVVYYRIKTVKLNGPEEDANKDSKIQYKRNFHSYSS